MAQKLTRLLKPEKPKIRGNRRLHGFHKKYTMVGTKQISLEQLREVLGLESVKDLSGLIKPRPLRRSLMAGDQTRRQALKGSSRQ